MKTFLRNAGITVLVIGVVSWVWVIVASPAHAECVPADAWSETVEHGAQGDEFIPNPDYRAAVDPVPAVWANFSPNKKKGTFQGPPAYPSDPRGEWHVKGKIPGGHAGPDGVYAKGDPSKGGNWFYRQAGAPGQPAQGDPLIPNPAYVPAWTEVIEHPAVVCMTPLTPATPVERDGDEQVPDVPEVPETPDSVKPDRVVVQPTAPSKVSTARK